MCRNRSFISVFPAGAGVIPALYNGLISPAGVSRRRGGDPEKLDKLDEPMKCFPQARG